MRDEGLGSFLLSLEPEHAPDATAALPATQAPLLKDRLISVLGVAITDVTLQRAIELLEQLIRQYHGRARSVFFVNAHTLNWAADSEDYRRTLNSAAYVFGDGTGVRWAARLQGIRVRDNLAGTDLVPALLRATSGRGYRYFLLGTRPEAVGRAAQYAAEQFPGWTLVGHHHGYVGDQGTAAAVIRQINAARPDLLLVGMGNPLQEQWIAEHQHELQVPVCMGVGGLLNYWAGVVPRAPLWLRRLGAEWVGVLCQQPHKARRYLCGNPLFLWRILSEAYLSRQRQLRKMEV